MYHSFIKPLFFSQDPESIHHKVTVWLKVLLSTQLSRSVVRSFFQLKNELLEKEVMGLKFKNPVGLAAGFDKDAKLYRELDCFGFGFIEVGTVTPREQVGNPTPRLFRLKEDKALINRMGFNNEGVVAMVERLKKRPKNIIIGGNIGKNKDTPNENAQEDYLISFTSLFDYVDYFVLNVSSPNTPNLRELQEKEPLKQLINTIQKKNKAYPNPKPIALKIAPDLSNEQLDDIIEIVVDTQISAVIATNTTISREGLNTPVEILEQIGAGGVSGQPVKHRSTEVIAYLKQKSNNAFPIIAVGGIFTAEDAIEKLEAGADLLQIYTSFIYEGPSVIKQINKGLINYYASKKA